MAASKVSLNGTTIIDISDTTAQAGDVASGKVFYMANGVQATGTSTPGVTGVKGNAENNYRTGDVNLTPANVGAKSTQSAVSDPTASGNATAFIATISQDVQGVITVTKKNVPSASQSAAGLMSSTDKTKLDGIASGAQVHSITGVKGDAESSYRTGNVNLTPANIGAVSTSDVRIKIYSNPSQLGLSSPTLLAAYRALPNGGILYATSDQLASGETPGSGSGRVVICKENGEARGSVHFYGKTKNNADYRMFLGANASTGAGDNEPSGEWVQLVTGVKGNAENNYRTGNVNLTPQNIGALSLGGGDGSGNQMKGPVSRYTGADYDTPPASTTSYDAMHILDDGDHVRHRIYSARLVNGDYYIFLMTRNADQSKYNQIGIGITQNGGPVYYVSDQAAFCRDIGAVEYNNTNAARPRIYNGVESLGLTSGSATIIAAFRALPDGGILYANANQFSSSEVPATTGVVEINRVVEGSRCVVSFYGKQNGNGDYRMYEAATTYNGNNANEPSGTWVKPLSDIVLASGVKEFGTLSAGTQTYATISLSPALGTTNYIVVTECISSNIVAGVQSKTASSFVLYVRNVSSANATGTVTWAVIRRS